MSKLSAMIGIIEGRSAQSILRRLKIWQEYTQTRRQADNDAQYIHQIYQKYDAVEQILMKRQVELCFHRINQHSHERYDEWKAEQDRLTVRKHTRMDQLVKQLESNHSKSLWQAFQRWRSHWIRQYKQSKRELEAQMSKVLLEKAAIMLMQTYKKSSSQRKALGLQHWRQLTLAARTRTAHAVMRGLIDSKISEINFLKSKRVFETLSKLQLKQQRQAMKILLDHSVQDKIDSLVRQKQSDNIRVLNRIHASYKLFDTLSKKLGQLQKHWLEHL